MATEVGQPGQMAADFSPATDEPIVSRLAGEDGEFQLTASRVTFAGLPETIAVFSSALLNDVVGVELLRRPRESRSAWWGGLGILASLGLWEVSTNAVVGGAAAAVVALISLALLADYWFRPGGVLLAFRTAGSSVQGVVEPPRMGDARKFVAEFEEMRSFSRAGYFGPTAGYW